MFEKKPLKKYIILFAAVLAVFVLSGLIYDLATGNRYTDTFEVTIPEGKTISDLTVSTDRDGIVEILDQSINGDTFRITMKALRRGSCYLVISAPEANVFNEWDLQTYSTGMIINLTNGNFSGYRFHTWSMLILMLLATFFFWFEFSAVQWKVRYSYTSIFFSGFGLWLGVITIWMLVIFLSPNSHLTDLYLALQGAGQIFMLVTSPFIIVFAVALSVSNIALIRHEGFRMKNALGFCAALLMLAGLAADFFLRTADISGSELKISICSTVYSTFSCVYCLLECFLFGAVICGVYAARFTPAFDRDYLVILGCAIRKDGTLYPLLRGRVDRAIRFSEDQIKATGKAPVFVPSGGKGSDEIISEAEAMKRYLLEHGIPEERILAETASRNTAENMRFSRALIEQQMPGAKIAYSTTNYHVLRSGIIARQNGFDPDGMGSKTKWYFWPNSYIREMIGMISYMKKTMIVILIILIVFFAILQFLY